jgi:hypothetical protein
MDQMAACGHYRHWRTDLQPVRDLGFCYLFHRVMATGEKHHGEGDLLSVPSIRKDGQRISLEFSIVLLKDGQNRSFQRCHCRSQEVAFVSGRKVQQYREGPHTASPGPP